MMDGELDWRVAQIVAATDLSDCSRNALDHAIALARATGAGLTVVHARANAPDYEDLYRSRATESDSGSPRYADLYADGLEPATALAFDDKAAAALARTHRQQLADLPRVREVGVAGEPVEAILTVAQEAGAAIVVVGSHARGGVAGALLGSTADAVIRRSATPVLAVPCAPRGEGGAVVVEVLDEPAVAARVHGHAAVIARALQAELLTLRVPNDGRVHERAEVRNARLVVIAFPREEAREVNRRDPNVRALLRSGVCPVLTIPAS